MSKVMVTDSAQTWSIVVIWSADHEYGIFVSVHAPVAYYSRIICFKFFFKFLTLFGEIPALHGTLNRSGSKSAYHVSGLKS